MIEAIKNICALFTISHFLLNKAMHAWFPGVTDVPILEPRKKSKMIVIFFILFFFSDKGQGVSPYPDTVYELPIAPTLLSTRTTCDGT